MYYQVVTFFFIWCGISLGSANIYYVSANGSCSYSPCYDFNTYLESYGQYFKQSNTIFVFLPGEHIINYQVPLIETVQNFTLLGIGDFHEFSIDYNVKQYGFDSYNTDNTIRYSSSSSIIICNTSTWFSFHIITNLTITNLTILNCGGNRGVAIEMYYINSLTMDGVSVQNSTGNGLWATDVIGNSQITRSSFIGNGQYVKDNLQKKLISEQSACNPITVYWNNGTVGPCGGGNVIIDYAIQGGTGYTSWYISSCLFSLGLDCNYGNFTPVSNSAGTGLTLHVETGCEVNISLSNITSYRNQAYYGAGINIVVKYSRILINMENINLNNGVAIYGGGISYLTDASMPLDDFLGLNEQITISNSIFRNNYAYNKGSSLYITIQNELWQNTNYTYDILLYSCLLICESGYSSLDVQAASISYVAFNASNIDWQNTNLTNIAIFVGKDNLPSIFNMYYCNLPSSGFFISVTNSTLYSYDCNFSGAAIGFQSYFSTVIIDNSVLSNNVQGFIATYSTIQLNNCTSVGNGAITAYQTILNATSSKLIFSNGSCAIQLISSTLTVLSCDIQFLFNNACVIYVESGGALFLNQSVVNFIDSSVTFKGNNAAVGGAVYQINSSTNFTSSSLQCNNNVAQYFGGCMYLLSSNLTFHNMSSTIFSQNMAFNGGGALFFSTDSILDISASTEIVFTSNSDGAIAANQAMLLYATSSKLIFSNSSCGAIQLVASTLTVQSSDMQFKFNNACKIYSENGGALFLNQSVVNFIDTNVEFEGNNAAIGGAVCQIQSSINFISSSLQCNSNVAQYFGGCMYLLSSNLTFHNMSSTIFSQNTAFNGGGALFFSTDSILDIIAPSEIVFSNNSASLAGGALYIQDIYVSKTLAQPPCFYKLLDLNGTIQNPNILLSFYNNSAQAGGVLYGGNIDTCTPRASTYNADQTEIFDQVFQVNHYQNSNSISSFPYTLCKCPIFNYTTCNVVDHFKTPLYPGQPIVIQFAATGQRNGIAPAVVLPVVYRRDSAPIILPPLLTENTCYNYSLPHYLNGTDMLVVTQNSFNSNDLPFSNFTITTTLLPCPLGFSLNWTNSSVNNVSYCQCSSILSGHVTNCNISDVTIQKVSQYVWIGAAVDGTLAYSKYCLQDVCLNSSVFFPHNQTAQCTNGHTGVMCSQCESNFSVTLGLPRCQVCSNEYLLLLVVFAVMGVVFEALIFVLNLTIFTGTLNGLLWYTFVVNLNYFIFFKTNNYNVHQEVLLIFAAWFNFDFGVVSCFYDGMDMYFYTWLQLAFPTYIFILIGITIICANYSRTISKLFRSNAVPVLATLIYMSVSKLVRMSVASLFPVQIVSANGAHWMWLYDGNIEYLDGKHLALAVFGFLILLFVFFPYATILLFSPWLQKYSNKKYLLWVNKLKPFLDNYQAPYKDQFRYWPGATLFFRFILCIITTYYSNNPDVILVAIIVLHVSIILVAGIAFYKNWILSVLETFFHINMTIMATLLLFYQQSNEKSTTIVVWLGVGSSLLCFVGILSYHVYHYLICVICKYKPKQNKIYNNEDDNIVQAVDHERDQEQEQLLE